eukprot:SAG31_NODE_195_length_20708_cov_9.627638_13_plen_142_part_00
MDHHGHATCACAMPARRRTYRYGRTRVRPYCTPGASMLSCTHCTNSFFNTTAGTVVRSKFSLLNLVPVLRSTAVPGPKGFRVPPSCAGRTWLLLAPAGDLASWHLAPGSRWLAGLAPMPTRIYFKYGTTTEHATERERSKI